jgi:predicted enzyme related to lactoylglutathione lyase
VSKRFSAPANLFNRPDRLSPVDGCAAAIEEQERPILHILVAELPVIDQDRAKAFYTEHLACQLIADQPMGDSGWRWIELAFPFAVTNLHFIRRADDAPGAEPVMVLVDDNVEATIAALKACGVEIITEPQEAPWQPGRTVAEFRDSEGNRMVVASK